MPILLISVHFHDGRYHGSGEWPPSPARLFQALVAGAARGEKLPDHAAEALEWLEGLDAPIIAAPSACEGHGFKTFVPNNDLDAVGGDPALIGKIRTGKIIRPRIFNATVPFLYAWTFAPGADIEIHAQKICEVADCLYQLGRGVDMAWARGEVLGENEVASRLGEFAGSRWQPNIGGDGEVLSCPGPGSLASLTLRFKRTRDRFKTVGKGKKAMQLFSQAPKPSFTKIAYNSPPAFRLFDIKRMESDEFAPQAQEHVAALTESLRDRAVARLKTSAWRRGDPKRETMIEKVFIGRDAKEADKAQRIRITPLPSIGHTQTEHSIRRVLVTVQPDCPIATADVEWVFSGLALNSDPETGEIPEDGAELIHADDRTMLAHYGGEGAASSRFWRTVTPVALSERAARRRIDPGRRREEAKGGAERASENAVAIRAVRQALRQASINTSAQTIQVQREPFDAKGRRAEAFAPGTRFAKERLWHVEIELAEPRSGPLLVGDGRYLGLGLMAPVRHAGGVFALAIANGFNDAAAPIDLARALRRAIMARVQQKLGERAVLPSFFTGHAEDGTPSRSGQHRHLAFAYDAPRRRLLIVPPHILERRGAFKGESACLRILENVLEDFRELRAGAAGKLALAPSVVDLSYDPLFARSSVWESLTPYRVTRHAKLSDVAAALEVDLLAECLRAGLPRPQVEIMRAFAKPGAGLFGFARLSFRVAIAGPILLGRDRHFGGGLFLGKRHSGDN